MAVKPSWSTAISRRSLGSLAWAWLLSGLIPRRAHATSASLLETDWFANQIADASGVSRSYRADAVIVLLSVPIYRRAGVGAGFASVAYSQRDNDRYCVIRFAGASQPERAAGLNRVGAIREVAVERDSVLNETAYFGVLTSSPEETLEEGRQAIGNTGTQWNEYTAITGQSYRSITRSAVTHFRLPASGNGSQRVIAEARASFRISAPAARQNQWPAPRDGQAPPTFLYALMTAIRSPKRETEAWYVYNERSYHLRLQKHPDRREGQRFSELHLTSQPDCVLEVRGRIREDQTGRQTSLRLWIEDGASDPLPLRIEFQPRSYLRLNFEIDPKTAPTPLQEDL